MNEKQLYQKACSLIPGGVNSPVRSFKSVGLDAPVFISKAEGAMLTDISGKKYIDYIGSWGPMIFGHAYPPILNAVQEQALKGTSYGLPTPLEIDLAEKIAKLVPSVEMVRLTVSGTEAAMSAVRLARAFTKRNKILKFSGCYHGHSDSLLSGSVGSGALTNDIQDANGIPFDTAKNTESVEFGDIERVKKCLHAKEYAAVILEPIPANMGLILPPPLFLQELRTLCTQTKTLLIFDEVITGFRIGLSGAQQHFKVQPDLTLFGKIIGGGFPVGAFGGRRDIMSLIAPCGNVYHAGTLSGNPIACTAGITTLHLLEKQAKILYPSLEKKAQLLCASAQKYAGRHRIPIHTSCIGSLFTLFFTHQKVENLADAKTCDTAVYARYFRAMLKNGVLIPMSQFEAHFISAAHTDDIVAKTQKAMELSFEELHYG